MKKKPFPDTSQKKNSKPNSNEPPETKPSQQLPLKRIVTMSAAEAIIKPVEWLIEGWLPLGVLSLVAGDGRAGKSSLLYRIAADLSRGQACLGLETSGKTPTNTLIVTVEDDPARKVVPFLLVADAHLDRVRFFSKAIDDKGEPTYFTLADIAPLRETIKEHEIRLVILDPAASLIRGADDSSDVEIRQILDPLADLAEELNISIVLVKHVSKAKSVSPEHAALGSVGWRNRCRAMWLVVPDGDDRVIFDVGSSLAVKQKPRGFTLVTPEADRLTALSHHPKFAEMKDDDREKLLSQLYEIDWQGEVIADPDDLRAGATANKSSQRAACVAWLEDRLGTQYSWPDKEIEAEAIAKGFSTPVYRRAKATLKEDKSLRSTPNGFGGEWVIGIGGLPLRPEPQQSKQP